MQLKHSPLHSAFYVWLCMTKKTQVLLKAYGLTFRWDTYLCLLSYQLWQLNVTHR